MPVGTAWPSPEVYPGTGRRLKAAKHNPGAPQRYVTYDTLRAWRSPAIDFKYLLDGIAISKQAEFAVILKMNPMFADLGADELQRIPALCHTRHLDAGDPTEWFVRRREDFLSHLEREPRGRVQPRATGPLREEASILPTNLVASSHRETQENTRRPAMPVAKRRNPAAQD
jgi:hypothetical protein